MSLALLFALLLSGGVAPTEGPARLFGGKTVRDGQVFVLYVEDGPSGSATVAAFAPPKSSAVRQIQLERTKNEIAGYGLALSPKGAFVVLADRGRLIVEFDQDNGRLLRSEALPAVCIGIWNHGPVVLLAPGQRLGGEPMLAVEAGGKLRSATALKSRSGESAPETMVLNLFQCGFGRTGRLPCWWCNGEPEVYLIEENERVSRLPAASLVDPRIQAEPRTSGTDLDKKVARIPFPIRDVFLLEGDSFWLLTYQEGDRPVFDTAAAHARHLLLLRDGKVRKTIPLAKTGRAILGAEAGRLLVLYADDSVDWVSVP